MADGKVQCAGSSLFLKNTYGVGYTLTVVLGSHINSYTNSGTDVTADSDPVARLVLVRSSAFLVIYEFIVKLFLCTQFYISPVRAYTYDCTVHCMHAYQSTTSFRLSNMCLSIKAI
jgi:hypothetical protein